MPDPPSTAAIEIQALYRDFAAMSEAIERRSRYLRDFAHAVSHEFKTPLAGIRGAIELLADHPDIAPIDRSRFLANADADAKRLAMLVSRLLELARADMASVDTTVAVALVPVLAQIADAHRSADFAIDVVMPMTVPAVAVPAATIEAVLTTLLDNSRRAGAGTVGISVAPLSDQVVLEVTDDGSGIPPADRERLFEPFFTTRRAEGGSGLGLPIARSLLEASSAAISLAPSPKARFLVTLPKAGRLV